MRVGKIFAIVVAIAFLFGALGIAQAAQHEAKPAAAAKAKSARGSVKSVSENSLVVMSSSKDKKEMTFALDTKTMIKKAGKAVTGKDLKEGDMVTVSYSEDGGKMMAKSVTVAAAKAAAKPANPCAAKSANPCAAKSK
jgi:outer membrane lipoprotein-sorting protein